MTSLLVFSVVGSFLSSQYNEMLWHMIALSTALYLVAVKESLQHQNQIEPSRRVA
jgi:hypothetical protein